MVVEVVEVVRMDLGSEVLVRRDGEQRGRAEGRSRTLSTHQSSE